MPRTHTIGISHRCGGGVNISRCAIHARLSSKRQNTSSAWYLQVSRTRPSWLALGARALAASACQSPCVCDFCALTLQCLISEIHALLNIRLSVLLLGPLLFSSGCPAKITGPPFAPKEALTTFRLPDGFRIELVAAEPDVAD